MAIPRLKVHKSYRLPFRFENVNQTRPTILIQISTGKLIQIHFVIQLG